MKRITIRGTPSAVSSALHTLKAGDFFTYGGKVFLFIYVPKEDQKVRPLMDRDVHTIESVCVDTGLVERIGVNARVFGHDASITLRPR